MTLRLLIVVSGMVLLPVATYLYIERAMGGIAPFGVFFLMHMALCCLPSVLHRLPVALASCGAIIGLTALAWLVPTRPGSGGTIGLVAVAYGIAVPISLGLLIGGLIRMTQRWTTS